MTRRSNQDKFESLIHEAMLLLNDETAEGIILVSRPGLNDKDAVDFCGHAPDASLGHAFGYQLGVAMAHDSGIGGVIAAGIQDGVEDNRSGRANVSIVKQSPTTH